MISRFTEFRLCRFDHRRELLGEPRFGALRLLFAIGGADDRLGPLFDIQPDGARALRRELSATT